MANIGATTAFYKVETALTRANSEVSKSMERLATGKQNANAGDRSSFVAMADTFRLDYVGTKAGIKGASVVMGYLETGMRVLDAASDMLSRMQELAVLGANDTNTLSDNNAIDAEFNALANELDRHLNSATYKGKVLFNADGAFMDKVSLGGRSAEMSFGMGDVTVKDNYAALFNPTDAQFATKANFDDALGTVVVAGDKFTVAAEATQPTVADLKAIMDGGDGTVVAGGVTYAYAKADAIPAEGENAEVPATEKLTIEVLQGLNVIGTTLEPSDAITGNNSINTVTSVLEALQGDLNTARVEAGSQYAAIESAINYTTDLTAQYELGYNTVNDVNFSMETAHLAKNQILQQAATAMLAQANQGQQGLLQLLS